MSFQEAHTLEEHRDYLYKIVHLQLFFVHLWLEKHQDETFRDVLRNRVDIYRKTDANPEALNPRVLHFDTHAWLNMEQAAEKIYESTRSDRATFETAAFEVFKPSIDSRCERDYLDTSALANYQCGSLRHELALNKDGETIHFHIANAVSPKSIFDEPAYLAGCFRHLMDKTEKELGAKRIATSTWLNMNPKWLKYFPESWKINMAAPHKNVQWHYGFWGQFISARHTFNDKLGDYLRQTGELRYYPCGSSCSMEEMRKHLDDMGF